MGMTRATKQILLQIADAYIAASDGLRDVTRPDVTLSYWVFGDSKKLAALRGEADITLGRFDAALSWFATHWPEGHAMPPHLLPYAPPAPPKEDAA